MSNYTLAFLCLLGLGNLSNAYAQEFPTGNFIGTGFSVEKKSSGRLQQPEPFIVQCEP
jgi:hypothetical protein